MPSPTIADSGDTALKRTGSALDTSGEMRTQELKQRVQRQDYVVDPALVAEAMLRHALSYRRCWKPHTACATPAASSTTSGGPSRTEPIHVTPAADSAELRSDSATHTSSS